MGTRVSLANCTPHSPLVCRPDGGGPTVLPQVGTARSARSTRRGDRSRMDFTSHSCGTAASPACLTRSMESSVRYPGSWSPRYQSGLTSRSRPAWCATRRAPSTGFRFLARPAPRGSSVTPVTQPASLPSGRLSPLVAAGANRRMMKADPSSRRATTAGSGPPREQQTRRVSRRTRVESGVGWPAVAWQGLDRSPRAREGRRGGGDHTQHDHAVGRAATRTRGGPGSVAPRLMRASQVDA